MKIFLTQTWLGEIMQIHAPGNSPGDDLRHDEVVTQLKNQNASFKPDTEWMLENSAALLLKSLDWRICMYALHAAAIKGEAEEFVNALRIYAFIATAKFNESFPQGDNQKIATLEWCRSSYIVKHLIAHQANFSITQLEAIALCLNQTVQAILDNSGETLKWHDLDDFLQSQIKQRSLAHQVDAPPPERDIENTREAKPFFDKYVLALLKEGQYERAISLARAHRWCPIIVPPHLNNKTQLVIRQSAIDQIHRQFEKKEWEKTVWEAENLFLHPHGQYFMKINYWSYHALLQMDEKEAAESIMLHLKKLYKNYGQMFPFMYNEGQLFADSDTLAWIVGALTIDAQTAEVEASYRPELAAPEYEKDVVQMNAWLKQHNIISKKDVFMRDYFHLKILKNERKEISLLSPLRALFTRSIDESLYTWEPELAQKIWTFYAEQLKDEKQHNKKNNWDYLTQTIAATHLPAALQLMKQI